MSKPVFVPGDILIPHGIDLSKWSVIACDQFSAQRDYWDRVNEYVGDTPSTLRMIVPEAYLDTTDIVSESKKCQCVMEQYLKDNLFDTLENSFVYVERTTGDGVVRRGIVGLIDLDEYEYKKGNTAQIRASENTVITRLPPRIAVRRSAPLELPHAMMLIDDPEQTVIEPLTHITDTLSQVYDFTLNENGGSIKGWKVSGEVAQGVTDRVSLLGDRGVSIVIGDGNHSLAAAKECWNEIKSGLTEEERKFHPARYAMAELNNVYDSGIVFEAIHRIVMDVDTEKFISTFKCQLGSDTGCELKFVSANISGSVTVAFPSLGGMIDTVQRFLDTYVSDNGGTIDYIHDVSALCQLAEKPNCVGIIMPAMDKSDLFKTVITDGVFPKKSFSIGHARDKRYYLECRKIR